MLSIIIPHRKETQLETLIKELYDLFPNSEVISIYDKYKKGKGWAIRQGLKKSNGEFIIFIDADMDIQPKMIKRLLPFIPDYDIVVGTKNIWGMLLTRKILTLLSRIYIRLLFGITVDTQTGLKLFKRHTITNWKTNGFAFDIEILNNAKKRKYTMIEVPIEAKIVKRMRLKSIWKTLVETIKIKFYLNRRNK